LKSAFFEGGGNISEYFRWKGTIPSNPHWIRKTRDIPVLYSVEILTDDYLILSQYTHLTDKRTDRWTDRQNCETNLPCVALHAVAW